MVEHWQKPKDTGSNPVVIEKYAFLQNNFRKKNEKSEFKFLCSFGDFRFCSSEQGFHMLTQNQEVKIA